MKPFLEEKSVVYEIDPKHPSQKCSECRRISKDSRKTQYKFRCTPCELELNADFNATLNILVSGTGTIKRTLRLQCSLNGKVFDETPK